MNIFSAIKGNKIKTIVVVLGALTLFIAIFAYNNKIAPVSWNAYGAVNTENGIALKGGDAVAYHTQGRLVPGNSKFIHETKDAVWHFSSEKNKNLFIATPEKYMPQYGGYCAFAVSTGVTAVAQPETWTLKDGRLYVFNNSEAKASWITENLSAKSDANWEGR